MSNIINYSEVEENILLIRGQNVILDRDVAALYGVQPREVNQAVRNNPDKFPEGYILSLDDVEKNELVKNFDRFNSLKHSTVTPSAFTEKGLYMLATILRSPSATATTIAIVETFTKLRDLSRIINLLPDTTSKNEQELLMKKAGEILIDVLDDNAMEKSGDETTIELNLAMLKIKHTIKRERLK